MKEEQESLLSPLERRIQEPEATAAITKAELDAAAVPTIAQAAPETDGYKTPEPPATPEADETVDLDAAQKAAEAKTAVARAELDATLAALEAVNARGEAAAAAVPAATATFTDAHPYLTQALPPITLEGIRNEIAQVIGEIPQEQATAPVEPDVIDGVHADTGGTAAYGAADVHVTAPSPDIEPSICPPNIGTAACVTTAIIGLVAIAAASM
jgi:hypothetical protein